MASGAEGSATLENFSSAQSIRGLRLRENSTRTDMHRPRACDGTVTFSGVALGGYTMQASKSGYVSASAQGTTTAGSTSTIIITLQTQATGGDGICGGGIPGFPIEATLLGGLLAALPYMAMTSRRVYHERSVAHAMEF